MRVLLYTQYIYAYGRNIFKPARQFISLNNKTSMCVFYITMCYIKAFEMIKFIITNIEYFTLFIVFNYYMLND